MVTVRMTSDLVKQFPEANVHFLICECNSGIDEGRVNRWKQLADQEVQSADFAMERLAEYSEFKEWRQAYAQFGLKPSRFRSSIEQLWRRALQGHLIQTGIGLVDLYCYISLIARSPMGAYDLSQIKGPITVRHAKAGEQFLGVGDPRGTIVPAGTIVYSDDSTVLTFGWNHRDAVHSCLKRETTKAIFLADSSVSSSRYRAETAMLLLTKALAELGVTNVSAGTIDRAQPSVTIEINS